MLKEIPRMKRQQNLDTFLIFLNIRNVNLVNLQENKEGNYSES